METNSLDKQIEELEMAMLANDFWSDKEKAKSIIQKLKELKEKKEGAGVYDKGNAIVTLFSGAGGDDAEDFSRMLLSMYIQYCTRKGFSLSVLSKNENTLGGYRNITVEIIGKGVYGNLKHENGVHRLVRQSPFNAKGLRQTSFSMVEVMPILEAKSKELRPEDLDIEFTRAGGPGGQNVNKRETAVRVTHIKTGISVCVSAERQQEQNKQKALEMIAGKLFVLEEEKQKAEKEGRQLSKTVSVEWGSQIRSYVLHPYKMIKDHRTGVESSNVSSVLEEGNIDLFIDAAKDLL